MQVTSSALPVLQLDVRKLVSPKIFLCLLDTAFLLNAAGVFLCLLALTQRRPASYIVGSVSLVLSLAASWEGTRCVSSLRQAQYLCLAISATLKTVDLVFVQQFTSANQSQTLAGQWKIAVKKMFAELDPAQIRAQLSPEDMEKAFQKQIAQLGFSVLTLWLITVFDDFPTTNSYTSSMFMLLLLHCGFTFVAIIIQTPLTSHHPFFSASLPSFWTRGWHQFLTLFLRSLAYEPVKRVTGSHVAAVLAVFGMSGLWHFLQLYPIAGREGAIRIGLFFLFQGFGCMLDVGILRRLPAGPVRSIARRAFAWCWLWPLAAWAARGWHGGLEHFINEVNALPYTCKG